METMELGIFSSFSEGAAKANVEEIKEMMKNKKVNFNNNEYLFFMDHFYLINEFLQVKYS